MLDQSNFDPTPPLVKPPSVPVQLARLQAGMDTLSLNTLIEIRNALIRLSWQLTAILALQMILVGIVIVLLLLLARGTLCCP